MFDLTWYDVNKLCGMCKGCEAVADGDADCLCDEARQEGDY